MDQLHAHPQLHADRYRHASPHPQRVFVSAFALPMTNSYDPTRPQQARILRRFRLDLEAGRVEAHMQRILRACGVHVAEEEDAARSSAASRSDTGSTSTSTSTTSSTWSPADGDFGMQGFASTVTRRRRRVVIDMPSFLAFLKSSDTSAQQLQLERAWQAVESIKATIMREFELAALTTSCGWSSVHLQARLLELLASMRAFVAARSDLDEGGSSVNVFRDAHVDLSAQTSRIDAFDEYKLVMRVADVPVQWRRLWRRLDAPMREALHSARTSLRRQQRHAQAALRGTTITRGNTCSAIAYRGFLQELASHGDLWMASGRPEPSSSSSQRETNELQESSALVVEDSVGRCSVLENGHVQVPSNHSAAQVLEFLDAHRMQIRAQFARYQADRDAFAMTARQCIHVLKLTELTRADGIPLHQALTGSQALLRRVMDDRASPSRGWNWEHLRGRALRLDRLYGLGQDGVFTMPADWHVR